MVSCCATGEGFEKAFVGADWSDVGVVIAKVRRWRSQADWRSLNNSMAESVIKGASKRICAGRMSLRSGCAEGEAVFGGGVWYAKEGCPGTGRSASRELKEKSKESTVDKLVEE